MFVSNFQEFVLSLRFAYLANRSGCFCFAGSDAVSLANGALATHSCPFEFFLAKLQEPVTAGASVWLPFSEQQLASIGNHQLQDANVI